ncbi:MAG: hypothetical protein E7360_01195 [Clostridiales bacterium]|nr:hypothetical protein [Clostridiales bacterium]
MTVEQMKDFVYKLSFYSNYAPKPFDYIHLSWIFITLLGVFFVLKFYDEKLLRPLYLVSTIVMWIGEIYKQFVYSFLTGEFAYQWYYFPLQFCSTPIYTYLIALILKKGKLYDWLGAYHSTYCLFAGITVMAFPSSVYSHYMGVCIQSMLHHSLMIVVGACALKTYAKNFSIPQFLGGMGVFLVLLIIAEVFNLVIPDLTGQSVNMYFIGNSMDLDVPLLSHVKDAFPYPFFVFMYILVYTEIAIGISYLFYKIANKKKKY